MLAAALVAAACTPAASPSKATVSLRLRGGPGDATVVIDEQSLGPFDFVAARGVALSPGTHHLSVEAPGYFPFDQEIVAKAGSPMIRLEIQLVRVPD